MEYVNFGTAGVKVSQLALGLGFRGQPDEAEAQKVVERAIDLGVNLIDCANVYGPMDDRANIGRSEVVLGKAMRGKRDDIVITSKVASPIGPGPNDEGLSRYHILREIDRSLKRLNTDHVDVYLVHRFDDGAPLEETVRALDQLVQSGKVRYVGCCNFAAWQVCKALWIADRLHATPVMCVQNPYSLLDRRLESEMFGLIRAQGLGAMAYSPLGVGLLSGLYGREKSAPKGTIWATRRRESYRAAVEGPAGTIIAALADAADKLGKTPAQVALAWVLSHPEITVAIMGGDTIAHLEDNLGALGWTMPAEIRTSLDKASESMGIVLN